MQLKASQLVQGMKIPLDNEYVTVRKVVQVEREYIKIYFVETEWEPITADLDELFSVVNLYEMWREYESQKPATEQPPLEIMLLIKHLIQASN